MHLRALDAESRVEAPGVLRRILFPRFGPQTFAGIGPLRAVHLLSLQAGATLPAFRLANLSVLRLLWGASAHAWLLRQDCGAGAELPAWTAAEPLQGVELWAQSRRSNGRACRHVAVLPPGDGALAQPGDPGWDAGLWVYSRHAGSAGSPEGQPTWWQQLSGTSLQAARVVEPGDGLGGLEWPELQPGGFALDLRSR
ncbi:MAG: hypothetical protein MUE46_01710 [Xanthomonadales bacterium]|jgi:hypothetical protein|nr:hypothetical protein [Xanthomonadales bacterium]